jgi:hypothetical protein
MKGIDFFAQTSFNSYIGVGQQVINLRYDLVLSEVSRDSRVLRDTTLIRFGGEEYPVGIELDSRGNYVIGGYTDFGPIGGAGGYDIFLMKMRLFNTLGVPDADPDRHIALFPNPATTAFTPRLPAPARGAYTLRDALGRVVRQGTFPALIPSSTSSSTDAPVSVAGLPAGLYWLTYLPDDPGLARRTWRVVKADSAASAAASSLATSFLP